MFNFLFTEIEDKYERLRLYSFRIYCLCQLGLSIFYAYLSISYPENSTYQLAFVSTLIIAGAGLYFSGRYFKATVLGWLMIFSFMAYYYLFTIKIEVGITASMLMEFFMDVLLIGITLHWSGAIIFGLLSLGLLFLDYFLETSGISTQEVLSLSYEDHIISFTSYFVVLVVFVSFHIKMAYNLFLSYKQELEKRLTAEQELIISNARLQHYNHALEHANNRFKTYAFKNSHEVRAPLSRLLGLTMLLEKHANPNEEKFIIENIISSSQELDNTIKQMNRLLEEQKILNQSELKI